MEEHYKKILVANGNDVEKSLEYIDSTLKLIAVVPKNYKEIDFWLDVRLVGMNNGK
jgi:hypothetical protein